MRVKEFNVVISNRPVHLNPLYTAIIVCGITTAYSLAHGNEAVDFSRDVRPILSEKCFACHGPDSAAREKDLRFDIKEGLFGKSEFGQPLIVPGDPEESEIYYRITSDDPEERMPPADSQLHLTQDEIDTVRRWIEQGAPWQGHWAFVPPEKPALPAVSRPAWPKNEIDYFILQALDAAGLKPSAEARKETLIRRLSLDLTGLPPTPDDVDAFLADDSTLAYEKIVDRLLASPHYGERMAFPWLDVARYSDTNGYQRDTKRTMWPWRDWVIQAFNDNMPFDQFTIEQLAGDLLPNATLSQKIATGFNRNHRINGEGGIIPEEYAVEYVVDRVSTTSTAWMGLTMTCARCHDHKFDPISQKEFYEMFAFFNRVPEEGKGRERGNDKPFVQVPTPADLEYKEEARATIEALKKELYSPDKRLDKLQRRREKILAKEFSKLDWNLVRPITATAVNGTILQIRKDRSILASGETPDSDQYTVSFIATKNIRSLKLDILKDKSLLETGPGRGEGGNSILTDFVVERTPAGSDTPEFVEVVDAVADYARIGTEYAIQYAIDDDPKTGWSVGAHIERKNRMAIFVLDENSKIERGDLITVTLKHESKHLKHNGGRFRISESSSGDIGAWARPKLGTWHSLGPIMAERPPQRLLDKEFDPEKGYSPKRTYADGTLEWQDRPEWTDGTVIPLGTDKVAVTYLHRTIDVAVPTAVNLSLGSDDSIKVWIDGEVRLSENQGRSAAPDQEKLSIVLQEGRHDILIKIVNYGGDYAYYFKLQEDGGEGLLALMSRLAKPEDERSESEVAELRRLFRMQDPQWFTKSLDLPAKEKALREYNARITTTMIMEDMTTPRDTYLLKRGVYNDPDTSEKLFPSVPALLGEMDESLPRNRLGFARWLINPKHPLTARVRVNQYWQMYFGQGIVKTSEDFGTQSTAPSHPELLDYLALEFIESGWDVKAMQKKIVMSAAYRQSSVLTEEHREKDPENILLGRAPRFRLSAEIIRDQALDVSGLLNTKIGGPSVFPYQPDKMWSSLSFQNMDEFDTNFYRPDTDDKLYRRGLYTFWKRTIAPPRMQIFDAPDRERCSMRQDITNTPIQAMVLLNDPTFVEASRKLAERMIHEGGKNIADRVRRGYKLALACDPDPERQQILVRGLKSYKKYFKKRKDDAKSLLSVGDSTYDETLEESELAAYTMLASVILNLDKMITRE